MLQIHVLDLRFSREMLTYLVHTPLDTRLLHERENKIRYQDGKYTARGKATIKTVYIHLRGSYKLRGA